jgi:hypothetical protein
MQSGYGEQFRRILELSRVETGSATSTIALRAIGGDEKGSLKSETVIYCNVDDKALLGNDPAGEA